MKSIRILIVDDDIGFSSMTKLFLENLEEFEVVCETDSRLAVERAIEEKPDLVLLDIVMPHLDGGDVHAMFSENEQLTDIPVLFLTSMVSQQDADADPFVRSGGNLMIPKTIAPDLLKSCILETLSARVESH